MGHYKRILLGLDLKKEDDDPVCKKAREVADSIGAELNLIHVVEPIFNYGYSHETAYNIDQAQQMVEETAKEKVAAIGEKLEVPPDQQFVLIGFPKAMILQTAEKIQADLIVVGSHGRHGISALFMRDTADDMLHNAKVDVLAVHV